MNGNTYNAIFWYAILSHYFPPPFPPGPLVHCTCRSTLTHSSCARYDGNFIGNAKEDSAQVAYTTITTALQRGS